MKHLKINTKNFGKFSPNNHGILFPAFSGSSDFQFHSTSTISNDQSINFQQPKNTHFYAICVDWLEFICVWNKSIELAFLNNTNLNIITEKISVHRNPNFRNLHRVYSNGVEVCEIFSNPNNSTHAYNEVSVKVSNPLLYTDNYPQTITYILESFGLTFSRMSRLDIALDGSDIMKVIDLLNKYVKSHTIQSSNGKVEVLPTKFNKKELRWISWSIGKRQSGISATVYDKSDEIIKSGKDYIADYWKTNEIDTDNVGRFEVHLNYSRLKKYGLDLSSLEQLKDAEFIGGLFTKEIRPWQRFFRVRRKDMLNHKKEVAIRKGREIRFIKWNRLPMRTGLLLINNHTAKRFDICARSTISFNLREILLHPNTSTTAQVDIIEKYATDYHLQDYVSHKIRDLFGNDIESPYIEILKPLVSNGVNNEKRK